MIILTTYEKCVFTFPQDNFKCSMYLYISAVTQRSVYTNKALPYRFQQGCNILVIEEF